MACVAVAAAACQRGNDERAPDLREPNPPAGDALAWSVVQAQATRHIATSTLETKDAAPGNQFVVLDVRVRNPDAQPQVVSEGSLVAVDASQQQHFATPVSMLADEFLTLQVLPPAASVRGKIAYEVPEGGTGVFYWIPGNSSRRILLHVDAAPALAGDGESHAASPGRQQAEHAAPTKGPVPEPATARAVARVTKARPARKKPRRATATVIPAAQEQARRDRCDALLSRNAQAEEGSRPDYLLNCPDYPLPSNWRAAVAGSPVATSAPSTPAPRPSGCSEAASRAARLVCEDPFIATLDRRLAQSLARALQVVDYPATLQRDQEDWRLHVRDACRTIRCLELAYGRRTAHMDALGKAGP